MDRVVANLKTVLPAGITITRVYDLAEFVEESIASVRDAILIGGLLAIAVLLVFLRDWRLTLIAAVTLPMAVIPTFAFMWLFGGTINLMSLGGLAVAIGLVIDDAVVVVENVHRRAGEGGASVLGAVSQITGPLISSTLTTVVVFAPLGLLSGVPGQFFQALSLSLSVAVLISLALAVSVVALMARWAAASHRPAGEWHGRLEQTYERMLGVMVRRPLIAVATGALLLALTVVLFSRVGTGFFPPADEGGFVLDYLTPEGSALADTDRQVRLMERVVAETPEVAAYSRRTGSELGLFATAQNSGDILVRLKPRNQRSRSSEEIISDLRERVHEAVPLVEIEFVQLLQDMLGDLEGSAEPIEVKIFGDDPERLAALAGPVEEALSGIDGVVDVVGPQRGNPEVTWTIDPLAAARYGLSAQQVSKQLAGNWLGQLTSDLRLADRTIPVRVRLPDSVRFNTDALPHTLIRTGDGKPIPLSEVATMTRANGQGELRRENLRPMAVVSGRLEGRDLGSAVSDIQSKLRELPLPIGYTYELGGQYQSQGQAFQRAADGGSAGDRSRVHGSRHSLPGVDARAPHPPGCTALRGWRTDPVAAHRHRPEHLVVDGTDPAGRTGRQERHHAARFLREASRGRTVVRISDRRGWTHPPATDPDDHLLHVVWAAAARAGAGSRSGAATSAGARRHRRSRAFHTRDAVGDSRPLRRDHPSSAITRRLRTSRQPLRLKN